MMSKDDIFWDSPIVQTQHRSVRELGSSTEDEPKKFTQLYEITINFPSKQSTAIHVQAYKMIWQELIKKYIITKDLYYIEYCKSGQPHLHGYLEIEYPINALKIDDELMIRDISVNIFKMLPKTLWKQYKNKAKYNQYFRQLKCPALCINMKNLLSSNWTEYIQKNAHKNCV